ncbi:MAG: hypothetical protein DF168_01666 [Candidatus Moanabacter tarae]|uniref:Glycosyl hydrolase family 32 N-terminal domain-containing protein n=1 Tax=Candidatus Moanibacter tarae TaxID=2200854 RepID=A0A2Z4AR58_9BACT|nr:MAG: hypothetical protein DF168_01666 [Candidatus Moanabacter tarae]|tara:strand:- start:5925 stop:7460 length:1536 start_codon:yes stop_codon:yes gene_type:complete
MNPIKVGSLKQLFVDEMFIESSFGVKLVMNRPYQFTDSVLTAEGSSEIESQMSLGIYSSVLKEDDGRVRIWYHSCKAVNGSINPAHIGYAESVDGIHFTKPKLSSIKEEGSIFSNIAIAGKFGGSSVWIDPNAPREERYKSQTKVYDSDVSMQFHMHSSSDGLDWRFLRRIKLEQRGGWDTQSVIFWDPAIGRYLLFTRHWFAKRHSTAEGNENYRTVRRLESDDLINWENQRIVMWPDDKDRATYETDHPLNSAAPENPSGLVPVDYYGATVFKYPDPDGVYLMLANANWSWYDRATVVTTVRDDLDAVREETQRIHGPSRFDARLSVSRDGANFQRCGGRGAFISPGPEGSFSSRMIWALPNPILMGDEIWIYYSGTNRDHDNIVDPAAEGHLTGIGRAVLRLDGFVSADACYEGGEIITPILQFEGNQLEINVDTGGGGSVRVEFQDAYRRPVEGYTKEEASFMCGNSVRMRVRWGKSSDVSKLAGKLIRIRFILRDCKLYAFQFTNT